MDVTLIDPARVVGTADSNPPAPINVLEIRSVRGLGGGPEKTILLGAARSDPRRFKITVCYIRDARDSQFRMGERASAMGVDYVEVVERHSFDRSIWPQLRRLIRERRIDIVHAHEHKTDLLALLLARVEGVIPLATAHGWSGLSRKERLYYFFDRRLLARFPLVVTVSDAIRRTLIDHGANPSGVRRLLNGIDHRHFRRTPAARQRLRAALGIPEGTVVVGAVGRLEPVKRFDLLLEAFARIQLHRAATLVLVGEGSCRSALERQARNLGLTDRVRFLGHREDVLDVHHVLDVYAQSSDSEGIPNAVLEAMALETAVVATDVGGTREIIDDGVHGLLVPPDDAAALSHAIQRTIDDSCGAGSRIRAARLRIERELSFDSRNEALEQIYAELVQRRRSLASTAQAATA